MLSTKQKWLAGSALAVLLLIGAVIVADYLALLGVDERATITMVEFRVKTLDAETGRPIDGVKVTCFQYGTNNACGQPASRERGVVRFQLRMKKLLRESWLFTQKVWYSPVLEKELRIMYIHPDYNKPVQRFDIAELMQQSNRTWRVKMEPLSPASDSTDQQPNGNEEHSASE